jgi:hypothetical protein
MPYKNYFFILVTILFLGSCTSLQYQPIQTPQQLDKYREQAIENYLKIEFQNKQIEYQSIAFGQTTVVKPTTYYFLDSLYELKYKLERKNKVDPSLEKKIKEQRLLVSQDTTPIYYIEEHIFTTKEKEVYSVFFTEVTISKDQQIQTMEIKRTAIIPKNLIYYFADFCLNKSFVYEGASIDDSEIAFYEFYGEKLENISNVEEANEFLITMLKVMKKASDTKNLDKANLIKLMTLDYLFGNSMVPSDLTFLSLDEVLKEGGELAYYQVSLVYLPKIEENRPTKKLLNIKLDPYLDLIEIKEITPTK